MGNPRCPHCDGKDTSWDDMDEVYICFECMQYFETSDMYG